MARSFLSACAAVFSVALLAGCATLTPEQEAEIARQAARPVTCLAGSDCQMKWSRAIEWVAENSSYKLLTQSDRVIQTMGPLDEDPASAFLITLADRGSGLSEVVFRSGCDNMFGCIPTTRQLRASFAAYVMGPD